MKILFDQNAPRPLLRFLPRHIATRSAELGGEKLRNGDLLKAAEDYGFEVTVTADKNISYQQNLTGRRIAIVVLPSGRWSLIEPRVHEIVSSVDQAIPGSFQALPFKGPS